MAKIVNLTSGPVWLTLTSGQPLRLSPGETSEELRDVEVKNNPKIEKLYEQRVIAVLQKEAKRDNPARADTGERIDASANEEVVEGAEARVRSRTRKAEPTQ